MIPKAVPRLSNFVSGSQSVRVLTMPTEMAERTWFLENGGLIACGPDYVGEVQQTSAGTVRLTTEQNGLTASASRLPCLLYLSNASKSPLTLVPVSVPGARASAAPPALGPWKADFSVPQVQPGYLAANWKASPEPLPMGADGDYGAYAWYRTQVNVPAAGNYQLNLSNADDWVSCFVNGRHTTSADVRSAPRTFPVTLRAGTNTVAFLTAHYGRNKLFNYYDSLQVIDAKGIIGTVLLTQTGGSQQQLNAFRWQADDHAPADAAQKSAPGLDTSGADWQDASTSTDVFQGRIGWAWFRTTLPNVPGPHRHLFFQSIDDNGIVFLNGKQVAIDVTLNSNTTVSLDGAWQEGGPNILTVAVQNTGGPGGLTGEVRLDSGLPDGPPVRGWKMHGGETYPAYTAPAWKPYTGVNSGIPTFYHTVFSVVPPGPGGPHPILRATTAGLSHGFVCLNGRNLGRYPEISPVDGVYLPESLLKPGKNDLVIFDEEGSSPASVKIVVENAASRTGRVLTTLAHSN